MLIEAIQEILKDLCSPAQVRAMERGGPCDALWDAFETGGFLDLLNPDGQGGAGMSLQEVFPILALFGAHAVPAPLAHSIAARRLFPPGQPAPRGRITFASEFRALAGGSAFCSRVPFGTSATHVIAPDAKGSLFLLDVRTAQRELTGIYGSSVANLIWASVPEMVPQLRPAVEAMVLGAAVHAALLAGAMTRVLEMTLGYANDRVQFGKPISKFQAVQQQLSVMAEHVAAANIAAELAFSGTAALPSLHLAAVAKSRTSEAAGVVAAIAHALHGAMGITEEYDLQIYTRRLHEWRLCDGSEHVWNTLIGKFLLSEPELRLSDFSMPVTCR